jgi:hypothetical protein
MTQGFVLLAAWAELGVLLMALGYLLARRRR